MKERTTTPFWLWINLFSLDAPLVAVAWQDFLARCYPTALRPPARLVLALTVWAIYLADRLMDVRYPGVPNESVRHRFYRRNRTAAIWVFAVAFLADAAVALVWLRPDLLLNGLLAATAVICYLVVFAWWRIAGSHWKQLCAAILFTIGIFLDAGTRTTAWHPLGWLALAFCALCLANLLLIEAWEHFRPTAKGWIWMLAIASLCLSFGRSRWYAAIAVSALALAFLDYRSSEISEDARRVLADVALLTPLLFR